MRRALAAGLVLAIVAGIAGSTRAAASERQTVGESVQGRSITAVQIGDPAGTRVALIVGVIHGDERAGLRVLDAIKRQVPNSSAVAGTQLWLIDSVNPDGMHAHTRKNAHGVDLNRNFPYRWRGGIPTSSGYYPGPGPASEPETRGVMDFIQRIHPDVSIWYHQPWGAVLACRGRPQLAAHYAKLVRMRTSCRGKGLRGTAISWETHTFPGSTAFVVEFPPGSISGATASRNARAAVKIAEGD